MTDNGNEQQDSLALELLRHAVQENIFSYAEMAPLLQKILPPSNELRHSLYALQCRLLQRSDPESQLLAQRIHARIINKAAVAAAQRTTADPSWQSTPELAHLPPDLPTGGWNTADQTLSVLQTAAKLERDRAFLLAVAPDLSAPMRALSESCARQQAYLLRLPMRWSLLDATILPLDEQPTEVRHPSSDGQPGGPGAPRTGMGKCDPDTASDPCAERPGHLAELARLAAATAPDTDAPAALQQLVSWPTAEAVPFLLQVCADAPARHAYVMHALVLRTGIRSNTWREWKNWLERAHAGSQELRGAAIGLASEYRAELQLLRLREQADAADAGRETELSRASAEAAHRTFQPGEFVRRWEHVLTPAEVARIEGLNPSSLPPQPLRARIVQAPPPLPLAAAVMPPLLPTDTEPAPEDAPEDVPEDVPVRQRQPPAPTIWETHIQPFLAANWYILAGLLMVVAGASLLAYFTWDKSAYVRYLFLPVLLASFTGGLAEIGRRLFRRHTDLQITGTFLLGGAVCLLPLNFMVLCRAASDPRASGMVLPAFAIYTALAGLGLWRWCGALQRDLRFLLGVPLLTLNLLSVLGDMPGIREAVAEHRATLLPVSITTVVLLLLVIANRFLQQLLTRERLAEKIVPWFFGVTLAATTVQIAAWRHFHLHLAIHPQDYALAVILAGAIVLRWERRACELRATGAAYGGESFLGYAALLLGILMAASQEGLRVAALLLAGIIWLAQAPRRPGVVHYWIGATFCLLGGAAVGMLHAFPKSTELNLLPALGLTLALIVGAVRALTGRRGEARLRQVSLEMQPPLLLLTVIVTVLSQYNLRSSAMQTGALLAISALFFAVRATRESRQDWLYLAAICAGIALPYLGCADMLNYRFSTNTLALGLSLLAVAWALATRILAGELWRNHIASVTSGFGIAGLLALILRLILADRPVLSQADLAGGLLLAGVLGVIAWQTRARLPGILAVVLPAILLPLFRTPSGVLPECLFVGSGMLSALAALMLTLGCFVVRRLEDHRRALGLFTIPLWAAAAWLSSKALLLQVGSHPDQTPYILSAFCLTATCYAAAIPSRQRFLGRFLFHACWLLLGFSITLVCDATGCHGLGLLQYPLLGTGVALTLLLALEVQVAQRCTWVREFLVQPRLKLLARGCAGLAVLLALLIQTSLHESRLELRALALFLAAQLAWHGMRTSRRRFGAVLFTLTASWLCAAVDLPQSMGTLPMLLLAVLLVDTGLAFLPKLHAGLQPLRAPFVAGATLLTTALALLVLQTLTPASNGLQLLQVAPATTEVLLACLLLTARTQACAGFALLAILLGYVLCLPGEQAALYRPWHLASLALVLGLLPFPARLLASRWPILMRGQAPQLPALIRSTSQAPWLILPGLATATGAAVFQISLAVNGQADDSHAVQTLAPFAAVLMFALAGWYARRGMLWVVAECLLPAANLFAVAVIWGRYLLDRQLTPVHIFGMAALLTLTEFAIVLWLVRRLPRLPQLAIARWLHGGGVLLAELTVLLLCMNYLTNPDLSMIPAIRFATTGLLALGAGLYFRYVARLPELRMTSQGMCLEALWHMALGLTLWCCALLVPVLRTPQAALYALALPAVACWCAAEWFRIVRRDTDENRLTRARFRSSAIAFAILILVIYVFRLPFQMVLFPGTMLNPQVYHTGAAIVVLMGLILFRARGLNAAPWTAWCGGLALITGLYFLLTWLPGLSPFAFPIAAAWAAVATAHLLILLSYQQSPLRALLQHLGGIGAEEWHTHRRQWGVFLTLATHIAVVSALVQPHAGHQLAITPLLLALASVLIHQTLLGAPGAQAYWGLAVCEILVAVHFDFLQPCQSPGLIPARLSVWFLLLPWLGAVVYWQRVRQWMAPIVHWLSADRLALICIGHLLYHGAATGSGLLLLVVLLLAALLTPVTAEARLTRSASILMMAMPWLVTYCATCWLLGEDLIDFRPLLAGAAALLGTGLLARQAAMTTGSTQSGDTLERLAHAVLRLCRLQGEMVARTLLTSAFAGLTLLTFLHDDARQGHLGAMLALALVWGLSCASWLREGYLRDGVFPYTLSVLSLAGAWIMLRRLLFLHFDFWTYEYDIWLSLGASIAFSAAKRLVLQQQPGLARTMSGTVWLMPVLQCVWLLYFRMGADLSLLVLGIQSMLFAWHGGGKRDSPYNAIAMLGFVGFVCLLFWSKLELRCVPAYTIPSGLGILGLLWLFGDHLLPAVRNSVRLVTVCAMLGSCGYYALLDDQYPVGFHLSLLLLGLAVMALGPLLRVQLYLYLGFAGFATDLVALVVKQFHALDRSVQMMGIGALLLLLGIAVVGGAILCKTRRANIRAFVERLRNWQRNWE
ncbi:MAG: hypothetical protein WCR06_01090 [bacterium]